MNKNNFHIAGNKEKSKYKLWVLFKWQYVNAKLNRTAVRYGFNTKSQGDQLKFLLKYVEKRKFKIDYARIYDNQRNRNSMK